MTTLTTSRGEMPSARHLAPMMDRLETLHETGDYSDFIIRCAGKEFKVHKAIVCPQSGFLRGLCDPKFMEGNQGEAILQEVDPTLLEQAIRFLYTGQYSDIPLAESSREQKEDEAQEESNQQPVSSPEQSLTIIPTEDAAEETHTQEVVEIGVSANGTSQFAKQEDHPTLLLNIRMYILADYLQIPLLKADALERCTTILEDHFEPARLIGPLQFALDNTNATDQELRSTILRLCSEQREKVIACRKLDDLLTREEPIAWKLLKDQQLKHSVMIEQSELVAGNLATEVLSLETRLKELQRELEETEDVIERKQGRIDNCVKLTQSWNECRNCSVDFDVELERHRSTGEYFIRCKRCRCRHEQY